MLHDSLLGESGRVKVVAGAPLCKHTCACVDTMGFGEHL